MVEKPVQQKDFAPLGESAVGGEDHRALFIAAVDELEEQIATVALSLGQRGDDVGEVGEVHAAAGFDSLDSERGRKMSLAGPRRPKQMNHFGASDEGKHSVKAALRS